MTTLESALVRFNPWWKDKREPGIEYKERAVYPSMMKFMKAPQILELSGIRRTGKTTLLYKAIKDTINGGFPPENILYFSFDEFRNADLESILSTYELLMKKNLRDGKYLLVFDEIQKLSNWEDQLKVVYDIHKGRVKVLISGSESLFIRRKSKESLVGRAFEFKVEPLGFYEFLLFKGKGSMADNPSLYSNELMALLDEFVKTQGFPELVGVEDKELIIKYIRENVIEKVIYQDIPAVFKAENPPVLESIVNILSSEPGQLLNLESLANDLETTRQTCSNYLLYLEQSFLIKKLYNFSRSARKRERALKKYYPRIIDPELTFSSEPLIKSKVFEWLMVTQSGAEYFWRDPYKHEVDMVFKAKSNEIVPVEVKYGSIDAAGIEAFISRFKAKRAYIVTKDKGGAFGKAKAIKGYEFLLNGIS